MSKPIRFTAHNFMLRLLAAVALLPTLSFAEEFTEAESTELFQIEYILFTHNKQWNSEQLSNNDIYRAKQRAFNTHLISGFEPLSEYHFPQLKPEEMYLDDAVGSLSRSRDVTVVDSGAWQQPIPAESSLPPISINKQIHAKNNQAAYLETRLEGELIFKRSRYMHVSAELYLSDYLFYPYHDLKTWMFDNSPASMSMPWVLMPFNLDELNSYHLEEAKVASSPFKFSQSRRLKYGEVHYLDHPAMGLIVTINKVELDEDLEY